MTLYYIILYYSLCLLYVYALLLELLLLLLLLSYLPFIFQMLSFSNVSHVSVYSNASETTKQQQENTIPFQALRRLRERGNREKARQLKKDTGGGWQTVTRSHQSPWDLRHQWSTFMAIAALLKACSSRVTAKRSLLRVLLLLCCVRPHRGCHKLRLRWSVLVHTRGIIYLTSAGRQGGAPSHARCKSKKETPKFPSGSKCIGWRFVLQSV